MNTCSFLLKSALDFREPAPWMALFIFLQCGWVVEYYFLAGLAILAALVVIDDQQCTEKGPSMLAHFHHVLLASMTSAFLYHEYELFELCD